MVCHRAINDVFYHHLPSSTIIYHHLPASGTSIVERFDASSMTDVPKVSRPVCWAVPELVEAFELRGDEMSTKKSGKMVRRQTNLFFWGAQVGCIFVHL